MSLLNRIAVQIDFRQKIFLWLGAASAIFAAIVVLLFGSIFQLVSATGWVGHTYQVIDALDLAQARFTDAQAAERGYIATCRAAFVTPFRHDLPGIFAQLAAIRTLTADNPEQQGRVERLSNAVNDEVGRMTAAVHDN